MSFLRLVLGPDWQDRTLEQKETDFNKFLCSLRSKGALIHKKLISKKKEIEKAKSGYMKQYIQKRGHEHVSTKEKLYNLKVDKIKRLKTFSKNDIKNLVKFKIV